MLSVDVFGFVGVMGVLIVCEAVTVTRSACGLVLWGFLPVTLEDSTVLSTGIFTGVCSVEQSLLL